MCYVVGWDRILKACFGGGSGIYNGVSFVSSSVLHETNCEIKRIADMSHMRCSFDSFVILKYF